MSLNTSPNPFKVPTHLPSRTPGKRATSTSVASSPCPWTSDNISRTSQDNSDIWPAHGESACSTPYTPFPSQPSDSPTNPFGRKRTERLLHTLPDVTSFGKHVPLRIQVVRQGTASLSPKMGGVHRIVQVPLNYTLSHIRCLLHWLFEPSLGNLALTSSKAWKRHNIPPSAVDARGNVTPWQEEDYLFEIKSGVAMFSPLYKPGEIKHGKTVVKVSNVQDPGSWKARFGWQMDEESDNEDELADEDDQDDSGEEDGEWRWEDEQDFTLSHVWAKGLSLDTAIVYHHDHKTQIHITVNNTTLPKRRGHGNTPYLFAARGRISLYSHSAPLPRPRFSSSVLGSSPPRPGKAGWFSSPVKSTGNKRGLQALSSPPGSPSPRKRSKPNVAKSPQTQAAPAILAPDSDADDSSDDEFPSATQEVEDPSAALDIESWNNPPHAFGIYLVSRLGLPPSLRIRPSGSKMSLHDSSRQSEGSMPSIHDRDDAEEIDEEDILDGSFFSEKETFDPFADDDPEGEDVDQPKKQKATPKVQDSREVKNSPLPPSSPPKTSPGYPKFQTIDGEEDDADNEEDEEGEVGEEEEDVAQEGEGEEYEDADPQVDEAAEEDLDDTWEEDENDLGNVSSGTLPCILSDDEYTPDTSQQPSTSSKPLTFPTSVPFSPRSFSSYHAHVTKHHIGYDPSKLPSETPLPQAAYIMSQSSKRGEGSSAARIAPLLSTLNSKSRDNLRAAARAQLLKMNRVEKRMDVMKKGTMAQIEIEEEQKKPSGTGGKARALLEKFEQMEQEEDEQEEEQDAEAEQDQLDRDSQPNNCDEDDWDPFGDEPEL